jgi:hypothetical protein
VSTLQVSSRRLPVPPDAYTAAVAGPERRSPWTPGRLAGRTWEKPDGLVDSVQWIDLTACPALDLAALEREYFAWVPRIAVQMVRPSYGPDGLFLGVEPLLWPRLIRMAPAEQTAETRSRAIRGGFLARPGGWIAFELLPHPGGRRLVVALRDFDPRLPRWLYFRVQTRLHERSTFAFLRQVARAVEARPSSK